MMAGLRHTKEEEWQLVCKHTLFCGRLHQLKEICISQYDGNGHEFTVNYLQPVVELLDRIRSKCEDYYGLRPKNKAGYLWSDQFNNIIKYAIHPAVLQTTLHKGDFYLHISTTIPKALELRYFHAGVVKSQTLSMTDCILMCSEDWTELLRSNIRDRFVYLNCIIWSNRIDRVSWKNLLTSSFVARTDSMEQNSELPTTPVPFVDSIRDSIKVDELKEGSSLILNLNFELLQSQVAYMPGSRDMRGGPVIYIDTGAECWEYLRISSEELSKILIYYYHIPRESVQRKGCSLVIDARESVLSLEMLECIGEAIVILQVQVPGSVYMAYVLTRKDSLMLLFSSSKVKDNLNFEFQFVSSIEKLSRDIAIAQLPVSFGGQLVYNHDSWIKFRTKIEPFMAGCRSAAKHALKYIQELGRNDLGYDSANCMMLLDLHHAKMKEVLEDSRLLGLQSEGQQLIDRISAEECSETANEDYIDTLECVKRLYAQMNRVFERLKALSDKRTTNLEICKSIKEFEEDSQKIIGWIRREGVPYLEKHKENGDSLLHAQSITEDFEKYTATYEKQIGEAEAIILKGKYLMEVNEVRLDEENVKEKVMELEIILNEYTVSYYERQKKIQQSLDFYTLVEKVSERWTAGLQYAAQMSMEDIQTIDGIERLKISLEEFMAENPPVSESEIAKITELAHHLGSNQVKQAERVSSRCLEAQVMLQNKQNQINSAAKSFKKHQIYSESDDISLGIKDCDLSTEADDDEVYREPLEIPFSDSPTNSVTDGFVCPIYCWKEGNEPYDENDNKIAMYDMTMSPKMRERLSCIIDELISTENEYVLSLEYVLENYMPAMDEDCLMPVLKGKTNVLFGNIKRIYEFHKRFFSQEVETFRHNPLQIGRCFLKWERQFNLYALYNKNKPRSDQLWKDYAHVYFQRKMEELRDKLDLASYLIKPVQRLGKYALLLKDMISCCDPKDPRVAEMTDAHELMKFQLRHGNDLLAMDSIRSADINLKEQGCLLRQGDFCVFYGKRKRLRRVFLFEHAMVFTKARKQKAKGDIFSYKHSIKTVDLGLTESIGPTGLKFEVWYRRWKKGRSNEAFVLQAISQFVKQAWTDDITRILWRQASRNKEYGLTEASTGISVESTPSSIYIDNSASTSFNTYPRNRNLHEVSSPQETHRKRHSWLSNEESSSSSGVHDLESLPEERHVVFSPRAEDKKLAADIENKYSTVPQKRQFKRTNSATVPISDLVASESSNSLVTLRRDLPGSNNSNFVRTNVFRKTVHCDSSKHRQLYDSYAPNPVIFPKSMLSDSALKRAQSQRARLSDSTRTLSLNEDYIEAMRKQDSRMNNLINIQTPQLEQRLGKDGNSNITDSPILGRTKGDKKGSEFTSGLQKLSLRRRFSFSKPKDIGSPRLRSPRRKSDVIITNTPPFANVANGKRLLQGNMSEMNIPSSVAEQLVN